jgi:hypothetical protein
VRARSTYFCRWLRSATVYRADDHASTLSHEPSIAHSSAGDVHRTAASGDPLDRPGDGQGDGALGGSVPLLSDLSRMNTPGSRQILVHRIIQ